MKGFVGKSDPEFTKIGLLVFTDRVEMLVKPTNDFKKVIRGIKGIEVGDVGICNKAEPFTDALNEMNLYHLLTYLN